MAVHSRDAPREAYPVWAAQSGTLPAHRSWRGRAAAKALARPGSRVTPQLTSALTSVSYLSHSNQLIISRRGKRLWFEGSKTCFHQASLMAASLPGRLGEKSAAVSVMATGL